MRVWPTGAWFGMTTHRLRIAFTALLIFIAVFGLSGVFMLLENQRVAKDAEAALSDVRALEVGSSTTDDIRRIAQRFSRYQDVGDCGEPTCAVLRFYNPILVRARLPRTSFLTVELAGTDKLNWISANMGNNRGFSAVAQSTPQASLGRAFVVGGKVPVGARKPVLYLVVRFTPQATADQKRAALDFNTDCLKEFTGCASADEMLPEVTELQEGQ
jgi:hypothetical protein